MTHVEEPVPGDKNELYDKENEEDVQCGVLADRINASPNQKVDIRGDLNDNENETTAHMQVAETDAIPDPDGKSSEPEGDKENEEGVQCGFLVDQINTIPYQKAVIRGEVPFCAFSPISTEDLYLLRIQNCSDSTRHMLVPASKDDVFTLPGALKSIDDRDESSNDNLNYRVAIVAIARQIYSPEEKQLVVSVDPPLKKDKDKISRVKFLTLDKFADFAFLGFDGDVSEFAKNEDSKATATTVNKEKPQVQEDAIAKMTSSPPPAVQKEKSPPRAPARRGGRGGRRRASRKSPPMHSSPSCNLPPQMIHNHNFSFESLPPILPPPEILNDYNPTFLKMEESEDQSYHILPQMFMPPMSNPMTYTHEDVVGDIPMPISEITVSTSEPGMQANVEHTNHDIITIALDQLIPMTSGDPFSTVPTQSERASRGGRRPGRKPGRKSHKEKEQLDTTDENSVGERNTFGGEGTVPKRRGRPPKNRVVMQIASQENVSAHVDTDDYETQVLGKRVKLQVYD